MIKCKKDILIIATLAIVMLVAFLTRISEYLFMEVLQEAKFVVAAIGMTNIFDIFSPQLNGSLFSDAGPLYYLFLHISSLIFASFTEFSARIPSVIVHLSTFFISYVLIRRMTNKSYAIFASVTSSSTGLMILFSSVSSPYMLSSCFSICAILSAVTAIFSNNEKHKQWYFLWFWIGITLSVLTGGLIESLLPVFVVVPVFIFVRRKKEFFSPLNILAGLIIFFGIIYSFLLLSCKVNDYNFITYIPDLLKNIFVVDFSEKHYLCFLKNFAIVFALGLMPWLFSFVATILSYLLRVLKYLKNRDYFKQFEMTNERKFFCFSLWGFIVSVALLFIYDFDNYAKLLPTVFFASLMVSHYWYKNINFDRHKIAINISSMLFYVLMLVLTIASILSYFFLSSVQKTYVESLIPPVIFVTLLVAIPGIIAILLKRKTLNYFVHVLASVMFFFLLTGLLFNYVNSFGENDLVNFSIKAQKDGARLVTYDIPNKYSMVYYFKAPVVFNEKLSAEEISSNYGNTAEVYIVLKLSDLAYFDKFFVYEIVATGKQYCEITNIKYLPKDEVSDNPDVAPDELN